MSPLLEHVILERLAVQLHADARKVTAAPCIAEGSDSLSYPVAESLQQTAGLLRPWIAQQAANNIQDKAARWLAYASQLEENKSQ